MEERLKRLRNEWKQRLSWVLICVMLIQTVISGKALPVFASSSWEEITDSVSATPADAFSRIEISAGNVNHDGKFRFSLKASLNSDTLIGYAEEQYAEHGDGKTPPDEWAAAADDSILPPVEFRFRLSSRDGIKLGEMKGSLIADGNQESLNGETIGSYQFKKNGDQNLTAIFKIKKRYAYACYDVKFGASFDFSASGAKEEDEVNIEVKPDGVVELSLAGGGENPEPGEESGYELIKTGPQSVTGTEIEYTITARVKPQAATASSLRMATDSGIATDSGMATSSELLDEIALEEYIELMEMKYPPDNEDQTFEEWSDARERLEEKYERLSKKKKRSLLKEFLSIEEGEIQTTADLAGKWITDTLPDGLEVKEVWAGRRDTGKRLATPSDYQIEEKDGIFTLNYRIASASESSGSWPGQKEDSDGHVTEALITVVAGLAEEEYGKIPGFGNGSYQKTFENQAFLKEETGGEFEELAKSELVRTRMKLQRIFEKEGRLYGHNGNILEWTIQFQSVLGGGIESAYIIDWTDSRAQNYLTDQPIIIEEEGKTGQTLKFSDSGIHYSGSSGTSPLEYLKENKEKLAELEEACADGKPQIFAYTDEETDYTAFILPMKEYLNKKIEIKYKTKLTEKSEDEQFTGSIALNNMAGFIYKAAEGGVGPGDWFFDYEMNRGLSIDYDVVEKSAGGYNENQQIMHWQFEVNKLGHELDDIVIKDSFESQKQQILADTFDEDGKLVLKGYNRNTGEEAGSLILDKLDSANPGTSGYSISELKDEQSGAVTRQTIEIHTGAVKEEDFYTFEIVTKVVDPTLFQSSNGGDVRNTAKYQIYQGSNALLREEKEISASKQIPNVLLKKESIDVAPGVSYDYEKNQIKWRVTSNLSHVLIEGQTLTDSLPVGVSFAGITSAVLVDDSGRETKGQQAGEATPGELPVFEFSRGEENVRMSIKEVKGKTDEGYSRNTLTFSFTSDGSPAGPYRSRDSYRIEFLTNVDEKYRMEQFKLKENVSFKNTVKLTGTVFAYDAVTEEPFSDVRMEVSAAASATNEGARPYVVKNGTYIVDDGKIEWRLLVNRTAVDMSDAVITDQLQEFLDLDTESLKYYQAIVNPDGSYTKGDEIANAKEDLQMKADESGFQFTIPATPSELSDKPFVVEFSTWLVDNAYGQEMTNHVAVSRRGTAEESEESKSEQTEDFNLNDFVTGKKINTLVIEKYSSNSDLQKVMLSGAEFKLEPMTDDKQADESKKTITRTTKENGRAVFMRFERDTLYRLTETEAPSGYAKPVDPIYFIYSSDERRIEALKKEIPDIQICRGYMSTFSIDNTPRSESSNNQIEFVKTGDKGELIAGAVFRLQSDGGFITREEKSGVDGRVVFKNLDPGVYTLCEISNNGYEVNSKTETIKIALEEGTGDYLAPEFSGDLLSGDDSSHSAVNVPYRTNIRFTKNSQTGAVLKADENLNIRFQVFRLGDGGQIFENEAEPMSSPVVVDIGSREDTKEKGFMKYLPCPEVSLGTDGFVNAENLYDGTYLFTEEKPVDGNGVLSENQTLQKIEVVIHTEKDASKTVAFKNVTDGDESNHIIIPSEDVVTEEVDKKTFYQPEEPAGLKVENRVPYGYVQVHKVIAEKADGNIYLTGKPLAGAEFTVYGDKGGSPDPSALIKKLTTQEDGSFISDYSTLLLNTQYYLKETGCPQDFVKDPELDDENSDGYIPFKITEDQQTVYIGLDKKAGEVLSGADGKKLESSAENTALLYYNIQSATGNVKAVKNGAWYSDGAVLQRKPLKGAVFGLFETDDEEPYITAESDENGTVMFKNVPVGRYRLREMSAPDGYVPVTGTGDMDTVVEVQEHITAATAYGSNERLEFDNTAETFTITVHKTDTDKRPLKNAVFVLQAADGNGTVTEICRLEETAGGNHRLPDPAENPELILLKDGSIWDYFTYSGVTETSGTVDVSSAQPALYYGKDVTYRVVEKMAPAGYRADENVYAVDKKEALRGTGPDYGDYVISNDADGSSFVNSFLEEAVMIRKLIEAEDGTILSGADGADISGFKFLLTGRDVGETPIQERLREEDIEGAAAIEIKDDGVYLETGKSGLILIKNVKSGSYQVKELESVRTAEQGAYLLDPFVWNGRIETVDEIIRGGEARFTNHLKRGTITGRKVTAPVTENSKGLEGALMGLFKEDAADFTEENAYLGKTALSGGDGLFRFEDIPYGTYLVAEIAPPSGYHLNTVTSYRVTLSSDRETQGIELTKNAASSEVAEADKKSDIVIGDRKKSSGNHGGGGGTTPGGGGSKDPSGPGAYIPPEETPSPENPGEENVTPPGEVPPAVIPPSGQVDVPPAVIEKDPDGGIRVEVPDERIDHVIVKNSRGEEVFRKKYENGVTIDRGLPAGNYSLTVIDENDVPLGEYLFTIDENGVPLASLPRMGDRTVPYSVLICIMLGGVIALLCRRRRGQDE